MVRLPRLLNASTYVYAIEVAGGDLAMDLSSMTGLSGLTVADDREIAGSFALSFVRANSAFRRCK